MNKQELINRISDQADISAKDAGQVLDAFVSNVSESLSNGDSVALVGFGTFSVRERAERSGRNPQTGEPIVIPASKSVGFKAGKGLKDAVN